MASRLLSLIHRQNLIQKASTYGILSVMSSSAKTSPEFQCASSTRTFHSKRHFYSSPMLQKEKGIVTGEDTFWQWLRATGEPSDVMLQIPLQIPKKMPYKKGQRATERITKAEAQRFLYPLFLRGWEIETFSLSTRLVFESAYEHHSMTQFINSLQSQEMHHVYAVDFSEQEQPSIYIQTSTDHTQINDREHPEDEMVIGRGITLRDARFAALLEKELHQRRVLFVPERPVEWNEETISQFCAKRKKEWKRVMSDLSEFYF